jgi:hypothetical protein
MKKIERSPHLIAGAIDYYSNNCIGFINDWCVTYDPRNTNSDRPMFMPFILFKRQEEFVTFILDCMENSEDGLTEKSRDMGATWLCCAISVWIWLFKLGASVGWGSRKEMLVDRIGDPDSIFEKMRMIIDYLPRWLWPVGFDQKEHLNYMKIVNPENGSTITGEAGDNIGRGGRKSIYFKDESARYEHSESIEAALGDNTRCQIDISTVHGTNTVFHRKRKAGKLWDGKNGDIESGITRIFIFDWRDHPLKTTEWYEKRRAKADREGLMALFAQEVDRDSSSAVEGVLIPAIWVNAAIDAHKHKSLKDLKWFEGIVYGALDVADEGKDKNSFGDRKGSVLRHASEWPHSPDVGVTTNRAISESRARGVNEFHYDCIGIGAGVKAETNRLIRENIIEKTLKVIAWNAAKGPLFPEGRVVKGDNSTPKNKDFYANLKAQGWWKLRSRFEKTYKAVTQGVKYPVEEMISIPSTLGQFFHQLIDELSQPTYSTNIVGKIVIDKQPDGAKSPNLGDMVMMVFWPVQIQKVLI